MLLFSSTGATSVSVPLSELTHAAQILSLYMLCFEINQYSLFLANSADSMELFIVWRESDGHES